MVPAYAVPPITFIAPHGCRTHRLAHLLDSLVRVSRRVDGQASVGAMSKQFKTELRSTSTPTLVESNTLVWGFASVSVGTNQLTVYSKARGAVYTHEQYARPSLPTIQFHALFHSLASGLFIVPSRYFFAIGLPRVFSLRWGLPPNWGCIPKQPDSTLTLRDEANANLRGSHPLRRSIPRCLGGHCFRRCYSRLQFTGNPEIYMLGSSLFARRY